MILRNSRGNPLAIERVEDLSREGKFGKLRYGGA